MNPLLWAIPLMLAVAAAPERDAQFEKEIAAFEAQDATNPLPRDAVLFVGSSSIRKWQTVQRDFPFTPVINRGFGGSEMAHMAHYADRIILPYRPRLVVVYAGDNDLARGTKPETVLANFQAVAAKLPGTPIAFLSIKPSPARWALIEEIKTANQLIREYCATDARLTYVDVFTPLLGADGLPRPELFGPDRLHLNPAGYRLWQSVIAPLLQEQSPATTAPAGTGDDILWGAMWETATYPDQKPKLPAEAQRQIAAYRQYVEQRDPAKPGDDPILKATAIWRGRNKDAAFTNYAGQVAARGQAALAKGYRGEKLGDDDLAALRDYAIYTGIQQTGAKILPFHVGASRSEPFKPGELAPDFCLPRLETVLASKMYSDVVVPDLLYYLKPDAADRLRLLWQKPEPVSNGVQLYAFRGKKPVVLILADPVDSFFPRCLAILEPIYQAYKDRAEFLIVHVTIHDTRMGAPEFFGPQAGSSKVTHLHPQTIEQRARTAKLLYMRYPNATVPMVLDDMQQTTRNAYLAEGGDARQILVDVDGKLAHDGGAWFAWEAGPYRDEVLWANELETELVKLLANGGKTDPLRKELRGRRKLPFLSTRSAFKDRVVSSYVSKMLYTGFLCGTITKVNTTTVQVSPAFAEGFGYRFIQEAGDRAKLDDATRQRLRQVEAWKAGKTYTFAVDDNVELFLNGRECEPTDFKSGDVVGVKYDPAAEQQPVIRPEQLRASRP